MDEKKRNRGLLRRFGETMCPGILRILLKKVLRIAILLSLGPIAFSCSAGIDESSGMSPTEKQPLFDLVHFSFSGRDRSHSGWGPHYAVQVFSSGTVVFWGANRVKVKHGHHILSPSELKDFLQAVRNLKLFDIPTGPGELYPHTHYADVDFLLDGKEGRLSFYGYNANDYARIRNTLEPFLRTMSYRCPVDNSRLRLEGYGIDVDFCERVFEFEESFRNGVTIRPECFASPSPCKSNNPNQD